MLVFEIIMYTLFGAMLIWFVFAGVSTIKKMRAGKDLSELYTDEEEHNQALENVDEFEKGYFERIEKGEQTQQFLAVGSFAVCSVLRSLLAAENIPTYVENEHINSMYSLNALGGSSSFSIKVFILISDYDKAREIVCDFISSQEAAEQNNPEQDKKERVSKVIATGTFFNFGLPLGTIEEAFHGITILPKLSNSTSQQFE